MEWIQVAGTNGKGSTSIYLSKILSQTAKCGLFTSPHINTPLERFKINGHQIIQSDYDDLLQKYKNSAWDAGLISGMFNVWTKMAIDWFSRCDLDYAVVETGLGGRKDPTNVVASKVQIITPINFDHIERLGNTIRKISQEKCGIIKPESRVISHPQNRDATEIIKRACDRQNCELIILDSSKIIIHGLDLTGTRFSFRQGDVNINNIKLNSFARVQVENACVAALAASALGVDSDKIADGIASAKILGRIQFIDNFILDAAHNPAAIKVLEDTIKRLFPKKYIIILTAVMKDKDVTAIAEHIADFADKIICTRADKKRGLNAKDYASLFNNAISFDDPKYAIEYARDIAQRKGGMIVVCGSFYLLPYIYESLQL